MKCKNCGSNLWQEHTKMWSNQNKDIGTKHAYTVIDNWHCKNCKSVFTNKEINEYEHSRTIKSRE